MDADELLDALEHDLTQAGSGTHAQRLEVLRRSLGATDALRMFVALYIDEVSPPIEQRLAELLRLLEG